MDSISANNKRIVKNTIALYVRMMVITLISFYTVRVTLRILGAEDYGIYNVVCGVIGFLSFITTTLNTSAQRYLSYDLGREDKTEYRNTFSMLFFILLVASFLIIILAESLGPWLINNYLVIPEERISAARWIYQISIISFIVRFLVIPYSASIIAYEKMGLFAYISIFESIAKLIIVFLLSISGIDKLIAYALWLLLMDCLVTLTYIVICHKKIPDCKVVKYWSRTKFAEIGRFMGWSTFGSLSSVFSTQGISIIMNMFFSPTVIASKAVADKVHGFTYSFVANFITATSPQMTKYYAIGDFFNLELLFFRSTKICYFLMLLISVPIIIAAPELLSLWLSETMLDDMVVFTRLTLVGTLFSSFETPISRAMHATGRIKAYQIVNCIVSFLALPIVFLCYKAGLPAYWSYFVSIFLLAISIIYRLMILHKYVPFSYKNYNINVLLPVILVSALSIVVVVFLVKICFSNIYIKLLIQLCVSIIVVAIFILFIGLNQSERNYMLSMIKSRV